MEMSKDDYYRTCDKNQSNIKPSYCVGISKEKEEWIKVLGSLKRNFSFGIPKRLSAVHPDVFIPKILRGLIKQTKYFYKLNNKLVYARIDFLVNSDLILSEALGFKLFKHQSLNTIEQLRTCNFSKSDLKYLNSINGFLVNKG